MQVLLKMQSDREDLAKCFPALSAFLEHMLLGMRGEVNGPVV